MALEMKQWAKRAALARAAHSAHFFTSGVTSTLYNTESNPTLSKGYSLRYCHSLLYKVVVAAVASSFSRTGRGMDNRSAVAIAIASPPLFFLLLSLSSLSLSLSLSLFISPLSLSIGGNGELQIFCDELMPNPSNERRETEEERERDSE